MFQIVPSEPAEVVESEIECNACDGCIPWPVRLKEPASSSLKAPGAEVPAGWLTIGSDEGIAQTTLRNMGNETQFGDSWHPPRRLDVFDAFVSDGSVVDVRVLPDAARWVLARDRCGERCEDVSAFSV